MKSLPATMVTAVALLAFGQAPAADPLRLENGTLALRFDAASGTLTAVENKPAGETYNVSGDEFAVEAVEFRTGWGDAKLVEFKAEGDVRTASYQTKELTIRVQWTLRRHFAEKQITVTSPRDYALKHLIVSRPTFSADGLLIVDCRHPQLGLNKGAEPAHTYFGRTRRGGLFTGVEMPFDSSTAQGRELILGYAPNLKVKANERMVSEPVYLGVYRRGPHDVEKKDSPLQSESDAMVAMTSALLPPQNRRLGPMMCGWWSETFRGPYRKPADVEHDMRSIDFAVACGIDVVSDGRTWAGETDTINALREGDKFQLGELPLKLAGYAREQRVRWIFWPSMGNSDPWGGRGKPFRADRPEWRMTPRSAACFAYRPSYDWLVGRILEAMEAGQYGAWCMDGDFFGEPGFGGSPGHNGGPGPKGEPAEPWVHRARCESASHDHLSADVDYVCQRDLNEMAGLLRRRYPDLYMFYCRPPMDLGVWSLRHVNACFTVNEWASLEGIPGMGPQPKNVLLGDKIRHWSRIRVHRHFFPHYLDSPLVFDAPKSMSQREWTSEKIDYILLSVLSSSPNQTFYLPSQAGIPPADKHQIKSWLDWGRKNVDYLMVRRDLADWPAPGKVDGSAHIVGDRGLVFLFNPNATPLNGEFALTAESIDLRGEGTFSITQEHPTRGRVQIARSGETIRWEVPAHTAVVLRIQEAKTK